MLQMSQYYDPEFEKKFACLQFEEEQSLKGLTKEYVVSKEKIFN